MDGDLVIRGGTLVDGHDTPGRTADVAVTDGTIVAVGERSVGLDRTGCVRPGRRPRLH